MRGGAEGDTAVPVGEIKWTAEAAMRLYDRVIQTRNRVEAIRDTLLGAQPTQASENLDITKPSGLVPGINANLSHVEREFDRIQNALLPIEKAIF